MSSGHERLDIRNYRAACLVALAVLLPAAVAVWVLADNAFALGAAVALGISGSLRTLPKSG